MAPNAPLTRGAALLSVVSNALLTIAKLVLGLLTGSVAVLSEAVHSASDLMASGIAFFAVRTSARPPDRDHPYGHEKAENLAAAIEGLLILAAGGYVAAEALRRLAAGAAAVAHLDLAIAVMAGAAAVNLLVSARLRRVARRTGSPAIEGDAAHLSADVWTSAGTAAGLAAVALTGWRPLDALVALAVAGYVLWMGVRLTSRAAGVLLDSSLPAAELATIAGVLDGFETDGVSFHKVRGRQAGCKRHVDLHMVVPPETTVRRGHELSGRVKGALASALPGAEVLIHLEDH
jgi:cation diffusion facilitator family transporter